MSYLDVCLNAAFDASQPDGRRYAAFPSRGNPHYILPAFDSGGAAAGLRFFNSGGQSRRIAALAHIAGPATTVIANVGSGIVPGSVRDIPALRGEDPRNPLSLVVRLGTKRANAKPVIALVEDGVVIRVAKIGVTSLSERLVLQEAASLRMLADLDLGDLLTPRWVDFVTLADRPVLIQTALPTQTGAPLSEAEVRSTAARIGASVGVDEQTLAESAWLQHVRDRTPSGTGARIDALRAKAAELSASEAWSIPVPIGTWHGDFTRWNATVIGSQVAVWDWERFGEPAPLGFDLLHWHFQRSFAADRSGSASARGLLDAAPVLLGDYGYDAPLARAVAQAYLVEIGLRYALDVNRLGGDEVARLERWLMPALAA